MNFKEKISSWKEKNINTEIIIKADLNDKNDFGIYLKFIYNGKEIKSDLFDLADYYVCQFYISENYNDSLFNQLDDYFEYENDELELIDENINDFIKEYEPVR